MLNEIKIYVLGICAVPTKFIVDFKIYIFLHRKYSKNIIISYKFFYKD
jgi:hypothetical protein